MYIFLSLVLVALVIDIACHFSPRLRRRLDSLNDKIDNAANEGGQSHEILARWLTQAGCAFQVNKNEQTEDFFFDFQGGHFVVRLVPTDSLAWVSFMGVEQAKASELSLVRIVCNRVNGVVPAQYVDYFNVNDKNELSINVHTSLWLDPRLGDGSGYFTRRLGECFEMQRLVHKELQDVRDISAKQGTNDIESSAMAYTRDIALLREAELLHANAMSRRDTDDLQVTVSQVMLVLFGMANADYRELLVSSTGERVTGADAVANYPLAKAIISKSADGRRELSSSPVTLVVSCALQLAKPQLPDDEHVQFTISLQPAGTTEHTLYYRVNVALPDRNAADYQSLPDHVASMQQACFLMAYDLQSRSSRVAEAKFMYDDMLDKMNSGHADELTDEQRHMCRLFAPDENFCMYWGEVYFRQKRFYEALLYFMNLWRSIEGRYDEMKEPQRELFYELTYRIGFCFNELRRYEQAFYYLSALLPLGQQGHLMEFINCLVNNRDFRAMSYIENMLQHYKSQQDDGDDEADGLKDDVFYNFLRRRRAYVLIDLGRIDEAEKSFREMLNEPINSDYALEELAYIQQLRRANANSEPPAADTASSSPDSEPPAGGASTNGNGTTTGETTHKA